MANRVLRTLSCYAFIKKQAHELRRINHVGPRDQRRCEAMFPDTMPGSSSFRADLQGDDAEVDLESALTAIVPSRLHLRPSSDSLWDGKSFMFTSTP